MKLIKLFLFMVIILFAAQAPAEIYKYVDDQGNIYFTDDLNQVPAEQRAAMEESLEYDSDTETAEENSGADSKPVAESNTAEQTEENEEIDDELKSSYEDEPAATEDSADESKEEADVAETADQQEGGESLTLSGNAKKNDDLDADRMRLQNLKKEIDQEYSALVQEKEELAKAKDSLVNREDILKYNAKVESLNKRAEAYVQKGKKYKEEVEAYNDRITKKNEELSQKKKN